MVRRSVPLVLLLLLLPRFAGALEPDGGPGCCPWPREATFVAWRGAWTDGFRSHDFVEVELGERLGACALQFEVPVFTLFPLFNDPDIKLPDGTAARRYNARWAPSLAGLLLADLLTDDPPDTASADRDALPRVWHGPLSLLLNAPNLTLKACVTPAFRVSLNTRSDLVPYRFEWGERGVLFTPSLGMELSYGNAWATDVMAQLGVDVGYANWWNWDGRDRTPGWRVAVTVVFFAQR